MNLLISALILLSLNIPADLSASCWEDYPWGKPEKTTRYGKNGVFQYSVY